MKEYEAEKGRKENRKRIKNDGVRNWEKKMKERKIEGIYAHLKERLVEKWKKERNKESPQEKNERKWERKKII